MATTKLLTIDDLANLDDTPGRFDLIRGELIEMSPAGGQHGELALRIGRMIGQHVDDHDIGKAYGAETGFVLARDPDVLLAPDVAFVSTMRLPPTEYQVGFMELAPDLVVEVVSPNDRQRDVTRKIIEYLDAGVQIVWLVEPADRVVTVFSPGRSSNTAGIDDVLDGGDVLPGLRLKVADIFR